MKHFWTNKKRNEKLIVFFNGLGMNEKSVQHLDYTDFDVITFFDYENLKTEGNIFSEINTYNEIHITSWSMGVLISTLFADKIKNPISNTAIAGTPYPVNDVYGIPVKIYESITNNFSDLTQSQFLRTMFAVSKSKFITKSAEGIKKELINQKLYNPSKIGFNKAIIPSRDNIFPAKNQINFWNTKPETQIVMIECGHYPFFKLKNWSDIIKP